MLRGATLVFLSRTWQKVMGLCIALLLARMVGTTGVGIYALLGLIPTYATTLGSVALGPAQVHFRGQGRMSISEVMGNSFTGAVVYGGLSILVFTLLRPWLHLANYPLIITVDSLIFPSAILQSYLDYLWIGENRMGFFSGLFAGRYVTLLIFVLLAVLVPTTREGQYLGMALALLANSLLTNLVSLLAVWKVFDPRPRLDLRVFWRTTSYGFHVQLGSMAQAIGYRFDYFLVQGILTTGALGLYSQATVMAESLWLVPSTIATVLLPRAAVRDTAQATEITARTSRVIFGISLLAGLVLFAFARPILLILGPQFVDAAPALRILLIGTIIFSLQKVLSNYFIGQGEAKWFQWATVISMVVNVGLNLWLIPRLGIEGAAISSAVSYSLSTVILVFLFIRWSGLPIWSILVPNGRDLSEMTARLSRIRTRGSVLLSRAVR